MAQRANRAGLNLARFFWAKKIGSQPDPNFGLVGLAQRAGLKLPALVLVPKKDGKVRVCVDFHDLNKASHKDDFPLPHIDMLVDSTARHFMLSFMDGFSRYNQIMIASEDMEKTSFITE